MISIITFSTLKPISWSEKYLKTGAIGPMSPLALLSSHPNIHDTQNLSSKYTWPAVHIEHLIEIHKDFIEQWVGNSESSAKSFTNRRCDIPIYQSSIYGVFSMHKSSNFCKNYPKTLFFSPASLSQSPLHRFHPKIPSHVCSSWSYSSLIN